MDEHRGKNENGGMDEHRGKNEINEKGEGFFGGVRILYEDNHVLVVVKPPNLPAQADASGDPDLLTLMKGYIKEAYGKPGAVYLGLVHRLDRPVGGLMVLARTSKAAARLSAQAREHSLEREYLAVAAGNAPESAALTDWLRKDGATNTVSVTAPGATGAKEARLTLARLGQAPGHRGDRAGERHAKGPGGQAPDRVGDQDFAAETHPERCSAEASQAQRPLSLLRVRLETGRSHQIRVQCAHAGFPLWGDARYGAGRPGQQIALWGACLRFDHPTLREPKTFQALPPAEAEPWRTFAPILETLRENR
jgi:23S rRNA pseudouridine1911/1915/1917 synthase